MPAPPPVTVDPGPSIPGLDSLLANIKEYGATLVVAVLAILALWRIAIRLEKSWLAREQLAEAHKAELKLEFEKRIDAYKEVQKISDARRGGKIAAGNAAGYRGLGQSNSQRGGYLCRPGRIRTPASGMGAGQCQTD
jgi:hypothetical protein